jgi:predicted RNase H-like HicB family nuclease
MKHTVDLEHDKSGWWIATARGVAGCHTQGRSIRQTLSRMCEALSACLDEDIALDQLDPCVHLPAEARLVVDRHDSACRRLERDQEAARTATDKAVQTLVGELSLSVRDAGDVLGLSHQRVHQLAGGKVARRATAT